MTGAVFRKPNAEDAEDAEVISFPVAPPYRSLSNFPLCPLRPLRWVFNSEIGNVKGFP